MEPPGRCRVSKSASISAPLDTGRWLCAAHDFMSPRLDTIVVYCSIRLAQCCSWSELDAWRRSAPDARTWRIPGLKSSVRSPIVERLGGYYAPDTGDGQIFYKAGAASQHDPCAPPSADAADYSRPLKNCARKWRSRSLNSGLRQIPDTTCDCGGGGKN